MRHFATALFCALLAGCGAAPGGPLASPSPLPTQAGPELRYLALGDSYTIGEGVAEAERWPVQLAALLRAEGVPVGPPEIIARTGWTTDELDAAISRANPRGPFHMVSLLIGVNNQYRGRDLAEFRTQFRGLLERAIGLAGGEAPRVLVLSIPDWGVTPTAGRNGPRIGAEIDAFNAVCRAETERAGAHYVDITEISRAPGTRDLLTGDGLHPAGRQYAAWAAQALPAARAAARG